MKEYWVNVYETPLTKTRFCGNPKVDKPDDTSPDLVYCLHVKMKEKPGLSREYPYTFGRLQRRGYDISYKPYMKKVNNKWEYLNEYD